MTSPVPRLGLLGAPNSGKTTLFNALTGMRARVGNYPGVTVERREARVEIEGREIVLIDLPGTYSLTPISSDEAVVADLLEGRIEGAAAPDALVLTADACTLERSLLLAAQVLQLGIPTCLVLTMVDELRARGGQIDLEALSRGLGIPVVGVVGNRGLGVEKLRTLLASSERWTAPVLAPPVRSEERNGWVESVLANAGRQAPGGDALTSRIDGALLHPLWGSLIFIAVMVLFFQLIFAWATPAMDAIDTGIGALSDAVQQRMTPGLLSDFLTDGDLARPLNRLFSAGLEIFAVQILGPTEIDPEVTGDLRFIDCETENMLDITSSGDLLSLYQEYRQAYQRNLETLCRQRTGRTLSISAADPIDWVLFDLFRRNGWVI